MPRYLKQAESKANGSVDTSKAKSNVATIVSGVIADIWDNGDSAVRKYSEKFDKWTPSAFKLSDNEIQDIIKEVPEQTIKDIKEVQQNVRTFAEAQRKSINDFELEIQPGVFLGQRSLPINRVGCYIPGGRYPLLASAHMTILTPKSQECRTCGMHTAINGKIPSSTVAAMYLAGADEIYILGGVQAVAAMACGTESMSKVDFLAGPGNAFVAEAKRQLSGPIGIDLFAGPTEILVVADEAADPYTCAVDLVSQAEHGPDTPAILVTNDETVGKETIRWVDELLKVLPTAPIASVSWKTFGEVIVADDMDEAYRIADDIASEHVQILTKTPRDALKKMTNYGALFLGEKTCVSYGDKCIGTNHVLPTGKAARYTGWLWFGRYLRTTTYQEVRNAEGHARSGDLRAANYLDDKYDWIDATRGEKK